MTRTFTSLGLVRVVLIELAFLVSFCRLFASSLGNARARGGFPRAEPGCPPRVDGTQQSMETFMTWGKGALLWLIGIPLPIILLLALFWR
jgi:hypothetical protein